MAIGLVKRLPFTEFQEAVYNSLSATMTTTIGATENDPYPYLMMSDPVIQQPETTKSTPMLECVIQLESYSDSDGLKEAQDILEEAMVALNANPIALANNFDVFEGPVLETATCGHVYDNQKQRHFVNGIVRLKWKVADLNT